ncbi:heme-binding protein [Escherichia coli]|uniref:heme-binding protein n=1 Tax=Escherichia coli TaxID=562 RepID=UPI003985ECA7
MKTATHKLADTVQPGAPLYGLDHIPQPPSHMQGKVVTFGGGFPLWRDGKLLGGLGISGGSVEIKTWILLKAQWRQLQQRGSKPMNNSELETLIRNILREQLVPATPRTLRNDPYFYFPDC